MRSSLRYLLHWRRLGWPGLRSQPTSYRSYTLESYSDNIGESRRFTVAGPRKMDGRRERSRLTRGRVVEAAARLFVEHGYLATTIEHVAEDAGVAVQTVYYIFGTKRNLLAAVLDASVAGDVEPVAVLERDWVEALRAEQDATSAVVRLVEATVTIVARTMPIYEVVRRAAADPDVSALLQEVRSRRR